VSEDRIAALREDLAVKSRGYLPSLPVLDIDAVVRPEELNLLSVSALSQLEPCGEGNPKPLFLLSGQQIMSTRLVSGQHLRLLLASGLECIFFGGGQDAKSLPRGATDLVIEARLNTWDGRTRVDLSVVDVRPSRREETGKGAGLTGVALATVPVLSLLRHLSSGERKVLVLGESELPEPGGGECELVLTAPPLLPVRLRERIASMPAGTRVVCCFGAEAMAHVCERLEAYAPSREMLLLCHKTLKAAGDSSITALQFAQRLVEASATSAANSLTLAQSSATIFIELGLARGTFDALALGKSAPRVNLAASAVFMERQRMLTLTKMVYDSAGHSPALLVEWLTSPVEGHLRNAEG